MIVTAAFVAALGLIVSATNLWLLIRLGRELRWMLAVLFEQGTRIERKGDRP